MSWSLPSYLGVLLTFSALSTAVAQPAAQPAPQPIDRIIVGEISRGCSRDGESTRTVMSRLRQGGVNVDATPLGRPECVGPDCAEKLKDKEGYLLGGDVRKGESTLWLVDLKTDQIHIQQHLSAGEVDQVVLAKQAGALLDVLHDPLTRWTPRKGVPMCREALPEAALGETAELPQPPARSDLRIALAVHAPRTIERYAADFQKGVRRALTEMGLEVREVRGLPPPANPRGALPPTLRDLPLLDIQLLAPDGDQAKPIPDGAAIRLSDSQGATQTNLDCATQDCSSAQLIRLVRRNAGALVDRGGTQVSLPPVGSASPPCTPALMRCSPPTAQRSSGGHALPSAQEGLEAPPSASNAPLQMQHPDQSQPSQTGARRYWVAGGVFALLGASLIATGIGLLAINGQPRDAAECGYKGFLGRDCMWDNGTPIGITLASGVTLFGTSGILFWQAKKHRQ